MKNGRRRTNCLAIFTAGRQNLVLSKGAVLQVREAHGRTADEALNDRALRTVSRVSHPATLIGPL